MTIEEYIDMVWFVEDEDFSDEDLAKKLTELGVSKDEQEKLSIEFFEVMSSPMPVRKSQKTNETT